ncbi:MAG TPA: apolipoprotein N-acyltransferase [Flavobacteriales bacterium]|nr:apolipoprotein N-acyltransferase [Flavobacteriales bacterium]
MQPSRSIILLLCIGSGLLWSLSWPAIGDLTPLAFIAWLPLLHAERLHEQRTHGRRAFVPYAMLALLIWNLGCTWWFYCVSEPIGTKLITVGGPVVVNTLLMIVPWWMKRVAFRAFGERLSVVVFICAWLAMEHLQHNWDLQWPWLSIGNVFSTRPAMVQWYEYTGVLGGSLWVLSITSLLNEVLVAWRSERKSAVRYACTASVLLVVPSTLSLVRFNSYQAPAGEVMEAIAVQPNIDPYTEKFGGLDPMEQLDRMLHLAETRITERTKLIVFPETALQEGTYMDRSSGTLQLHGLWENDISASLSAERMKRFQAMHARVGLLTGMSSARMLERGEVPTSTAHPLGDGKHYYEQYNAALWMPARGKVECYHKSKLVTGAESMPFEDVLGGMAVRLGGTSSTLGKQAERSVLRDGATPVAVAPVICYESVFGEHVAAHVRNGANLIAIITNDGWWDDSPGYKQHLAFASLRAIENRRCIVRSANTGTSCFVDQRGVISDASEWWKEDASVGEVRLNQHITFFTAHGDMIGRPAAVLAMLLLLAAMVQRMRKRSV